LIVRCYLTILILIALVTFVWRILDTIPQQPSLFYWLLTSLGFNTKSYFTNGGINDTLAPFMLLFPIGVVIWDLWLMLQTLIMSTNSIRRERDGNSWDLLLLTGAGSRQIIRAKWRVVVNRQWRDYVLLAIMRIGAVSFLALNFSVEFSFGRFPYFSYGSLGPDTEPARTIVYVTAISIVLLSAALISILTLLNLMFTAACGLVGGSLVQRLPLALVSGIGTRIFIVVVLAILFGVPGYLVLKPDIETFNYYPDPVINTVFLILALIGSTMIDNGGIAAGLLMRFGYNYRWSPELYGFELFSYYLRGNGPAFLTALLLSIVILVILTYALLRRTENIIARQI